MSGLSIKDRIDGPSTGVGDVLNYFTMINNKCFDAKVSLKRKHEQKAKHVLFQNRS